MKEQSKWVSEDINQSILQGVRDVINQHMTNLQNADRAEELDQKIQAEQAALEKQHASWVVDEPGKFHLRFMSLLLAGYRILQGVLTKDDALILLKKAAIEPSRQDILQGVRYALNYAPDPMKVLTDASKEREEEFFGQTFAFERIQDDNHAYLLHVNGCFYHRFSVENNVPELMQILCAWDWSWADAIQPEKDGFKFELPTTLGLGGDVCRFYFRRNPR
jgi:hypothetical protein